MDELFQTLVIYVAITAPIIISLLVWGRAEEDMLNIDKLKPGMIIYDKRKPRTYRTVELDPTTGKIWTWKGIRVRKPNGTPDTIKQLAFWEVLNK